MAPSEDLTWLFAAATVELTATKSVILAVGEVLS
ncbi:MAG: hypothetical protein FD154_1583, partial [Elusimicrobia bacterium]